jgi:hypothetical protein
VQAKNMISSEEGVSILKDWKGKSLGMTVVRPSSPNDVESSWDSACIVDVSSEKLTIFCRSGGDEETIEFDLQRANFDCVGNERVRFLEVFLANETRLLVGKVIL